MTKILVKDPTIKIRKSMKPYTIEDYFAHGLIILDKPSGLRCREVTEKLKNILEISHAGHAGTLDPKVTGVLPIGIEKATKVLGLLSKYPKTYEGEMRLHGVVSQKSVKEGTNKFTGKIKQLPPKISAVKRVYRIREVYSFEVLEFKDRNVQYRVHCQAGTYIRKLCHDLGEYLGIGAHMTKLRRTQSGIFTIKDSLTMDKLITNYKKFLVSNDLAYIKKLIKPVEVIAKDLPKIWVDDGAVPKIILGSPIFAPGVLQLTSDIVKDSVVAILSRQNRLIGLGKGVINSEQIMENKRGLSVKTDTILIPLKH